jgi:hypothetical protein
MILFVGIHAAALTIFIFEWVSPQSFNMKKYAPPGNISFFKIANF